MLDREKMPITEEELSLARKRTGSRMQARSRVADFCTRLNRRPAGSQTFMAESNAQVSLTASRWRPVQLDRLRFFLKCKILIPGELQGQ
jgi:hypothetical protein